MSLLLYLVAAVLLLTGAGFIVYELVWNKKKRGREVLLQIQIPRALQDDENKTRGKEGVIEEINKSEQLLAALSALDAPFTLEVAVHQSAEEIYFYLAVPTDKADYVAHQIQGLFPDAQVLETSDYNVFFHGGGSAGAYLVLKEHYMLPLRSYREAELDTFLPILSTLSKLKEVGEGAALQIVVEPADKGAKKVVIEAIRKLQEGETLAKVLKRGVLHEIGKWIKPKKEKKEGEVAGDRLADQSAIEALNEKIKRPLFVANIRMVASAESEARASDILLAIASAFAQFSSPMRNALVTIKPKRLAQHFMDFSFRAFDAKHAVTLNTAELASLFHLPTGDVDVPHIKWAKTRESAPPENLPKDGIVIGESNFRGEHRQVRMRTDDRRRHLYIIGQTGTGKSYFMQNMIVQDMENGDGCCVMDPLAETVNAVLAKVPAHRLDDVIVFDPSDIQRPLGLNMLEYDLNRPEEKSFIVNEMLSIFDKLFEKQPEGLGPMFQQYMRNSLLLLMEDAKNEPGTLMEVPRIFTDDEFRKRKLARITNPSVIDFWEKEATKTTGETSLANMAPYITTKFGSFISNDYMRPIIGQTKSAFNFREIMDQKKILLVPLAKGKIGDLNAQLLGMIITGKLLMAALGRTDMDPKDRKDFYLYMDEFQNYSTDSIGVILSEARKYRLDLILAHQFIGQLKDEIRGAVFGNVGSMACFRVGVPDTEHLEKEFSPEFTMKDLTSVENGHTFMKLLIDGQPSKPFSMKTTRWEDGPKELREKVKELSRLTYGQDLEEIEADILRRLRL